MFQKVLCSLCSIQIQISEAVQKHSLLFRSIRCFVGSEAVLLVQKLVIIQLCFGSEVVLLVQKLFCSQGSGFVMWGLDIISFVGLQSEPAMFFYLLSHLLVYPPFYLVTSV
jgi:hypothetical protein